MALRLARASSQLARRAARGRSVHQPRHGDPRPWFLGSAPPLFPASSPAAAEVGGHKGFCSVRRFTAGDRSAAAAAVSEDELPENGLNTDGDDQVYGSCMFYSLSAVLCQRTQLDQQQGEAVGSRQVPRS
jgi:hypothetical protein